MDITVKFAGDSYSRNYHENATVADVLNDYDLKLAAGWGDRVRVLKSGVQLSATHRLINGDTLIVETAANDKAVALIG